MQHNGGTVHFIEAPALDSAMREEEDVFEEWGYWLVQTYTRGVRINGLVYLHNILDPRLTHTALTGIEILKRICGVKNFEAITMATTRWDKINPGEGEKRVLELVRTERYWGAIHDGLCRLARLNNTRKSCMEIVNQIQGRQKEYSLAFQREMVDQRKALHETEAGKFLYKNWFQQKGELDREISGLQEDLNEWSKERTDGLRDKMTQISKEINQNLTQAEKKQKSIEGLQKTMEELTGIWDVKVKDDLSRVKHELSRSKDHLDALERIHRDTLEGKAHPVEARKEFEKELRRMRRRMKALEREESRRTEVYGLISDVAPVVGTALTIALPFMCNIM
jgi:hypothetical protein